MDEDIYSYPVAMIPGHQAALSGLSWQVSWRVMGNFEI